MDVITTGEQKNKTAMLETLFNIFKTGASSPGMLQDPCSRASSISLSRWPACRQSCYNRVQPLSSRLHSQARSKTHQRRCRMRWRAPFSGHQSSAPGSRVRPDAPLAAPRGQQLVQRSRQPRRFQRSEFVARQALPRVHSQQCGVLRNAFVL